MNKLDNKVGKLKFFFRFSSIRAYPYYFVTPAVIYLISIFFYPMLYSINLSLRRVKIFELTTGGVFIGLQNFLHALTDPMLWNALKNTVVFMLVAVSFEFIFGMGIAILLNTKFYGRRIVRSIALTPLMLTPVVLGVTFKMMFNYLYGLINWVLMLFGINPILWLADPFWAMVSILITEIWNQTPFITLIILAGLQSIPVDLYEASKVDGANSWQIFWCIKLPMLRPMIFVALFWRCVATFRVYDIIFALTGGDPAGATESMSILVNKIAFNYGQFGYAAALSVIMVMIMYVFVIIYNKFLAESD